MPRWPKNDPPRVRYGHCCGCRKLVDQTLFRVFPQERWRCAKCYKKETGYPIST